MALPNGRNVYVISVEDINIHRLEGIAFSATYPKEDEDYEWAYRMFLIHKRNLDHTYLEKQAKATNVWPLVQEWIE